MLGRASPNIPSIRNSIGRDFYEDNLHDSNLIPFFFLMKKMDQVFLWKSHEGEEPPVGIRIRPRYEKGKVDGFLCPLVERFFMSLWGLTVGPDTNKRREREPDG